MSTAPIILRENNYSLEDVNTLRQQEIWRIVDVYESQLNELFDITYPHLLVASSYQEKKELFIAERLQNSMVKGDWIYFPWNGYLIHSVNQEEYFLLRTNRNRNLLTFEEQKTLRDCHIGFVGLSIGSHFAKSIAYSGMASSMKIADFDVISTSNLNRLPAAIHEIGVSKIDVLSQQIYEINPYANIEAFSRGLDDSNVQSFLEKGKKLSIIFEAIDDFKMKIKLRIEARKARIPVIMFTNLGDNILIDVERYDLEPGLPLFNGVIGNTPEEILATDITEKEKIKYAIQIVGVEHLSTPILKTLFEINKTLVGRPQLYGTVATAGGLAATIVRYVLLGKNVKSGRTFLSFSDMLIGKERKYEIDEERENILQKLKENFNI